MSFDKNSPIKSIYSQPIGCDIIQRLLLQMGKSEKLVDNPIIGNLKFKHLKFLTKGFISDGLIDSICNLLNQSKDERIIPSPETKSWWRSAVFYQIYPRSFKDTNGDGVGDIPGIIEKLDYLKALGINALWLSPIYDSPMDDMGYDIRDYQKISAEYGTMEDFDHLLEELHSRDMKLIMDLVVNHTSDEHEWFQAALRESDSIYKDFYIGREDKEAPNNWTSFFSGPAWNYYSEPNMWYMHLFSKKQMDLNWECAALRQKIYDMVNWWLSKGVDGFRLDVINYISKQPGLPDGNETIGKLMGFTGIEHYFHGPRLHEYLRELRENTFDKYGAVTVGEAPGCGLQISRLLIHESRKELDMVFSFDHLESPGKSKFDDYKYSLPALKKMLIKWQLELGPGAQNTLFFENHDNPRMLSKILGNGDHPHRFILAKLLAVLQLTLKGTPFIFQGQELGMINNAFSDISAFRDVESINLYNEILPKVGAEAALNKVLSGSRDHARTPMQWSDEKHSGFTSGTPWLEVNKGYPSCNAAAQEQDQTSVLNFYRSMLNLRSSHESLIYGEFRLKKTSDELFCYYRGDDFYIELNLTEKAQKRSPITGFTKILSNYPTNEKTLQPYEASIYRKN